MKTSSLNKILAVVALLGFGTMVLFWWTGPHQGMDHQCISATIQNGVCPDATTQQAALFHIETLQSFSNVSLQAAQVLGLLALVVLLLILAEHFRTGATYFGRRFSRAAIALSPPPQYRHWLSLLEHSPSAS